MASYRLIINGRPVIVAGDNAEASLERIRVAYDAPRELVFRWFGTPRLGTEVALEWDGQTIFRGKLYERRPAPDLGGRYTCTCYGLEEVINDAAVEEQVTGYPIWPLVGNSMTDVLSQLFASPAGTRVKALGIVGFEGAGREPIPPVVLRNVGFGDAVTQILRKVTGYAWLVNPHTRKLHVVNVYDSPILTLTVAADRIVDLDLTESVRGRFTAIRYVGRSDLSLADEAVKLDPDWSSAAEKEWTIDRAAQVEGAADPPTGGLADVFRKYKFEAVKNRVVRSEEVRLVQEVATGSGGVEHYPVEIAEIDFDSGRVWSKMPLLRSPGPDAVSRDNPRSPGKAKKAKAVYLAYKAPTGVKPGFRIPTSGWFGPAYTQARIERERIIYAEEEGDVTWTRARRLLITGSDILIHGTVTLVGDPPAGIWHLDRRVNLRAIGRPTGLEGMRGILTGFVHDFTTQRTTLEFSTDTAPFIGEGQF